MKWFVEKTKRLVQLVQDYRAERWYRWYCNLSEEEQRRELLGEEEWRKEKQWHLECEEAYRQHREEEAEKQRLREERAEDAMHAYFEEKSRCPNCGESGSYCCCPPYSGERYEVSEDETSIINRQNAAFDEEEEPASPEVEYWFTRCPKCNCYPEFCTCNEEK